MSDWILFVEFNRVRRLYLEKLSTSHFFLLRVDGSLICNTYSNVEGYFALRELLPEMVHGFFFESPLRFLEVSRRRVVLGA